jgi:hypothetical protein
MYSYPRYAYRRPPEFDAQRPLRHRLAVIGAGPVGLRAAIDLARLLRQARWKSSTGLTSATVA